MPDELRSQKKHIYRAIVALIAQSPELINRSLDLEGAIVAHCYKARNVRRSFGFKRKGRYSNMKVSHEDRRLAFLHSLNILNTPIEEIYERITRLLCRVLDAPMAAVSLVDEERLWFKSIQGANISEMPRKNSFCTQTISKTGPMVVQDARLDNRFSTSKVVREEPNVVFYAGNPIEVANGIKIGTLCIFDTRPRELSSDDLQFLEDLSLTVSSEMKARLLKDVYSARHEGQI